MEVTNCSDVNLYSGGGSSIASFTLAAGDTYVATPTYSQAVGTNYDTVAVGFAQSIGTAVAGSGSQAWMTSSPAGTTDTLSSHPTTSTVQGAGYLNTANGFSMVAAFAGNSNARATLTTTANNDLFGGVPAYSFVTGTVSGNAYAVYAVTFGNVVATAGGSQSIAYLGTSGNAGDTFVATPTDGIVTGTNYSNDAKGFAFVATWGSSNETATMATGTGKDYFVARPDNSLVTNGSTYTNYAISFGNVVATAGSSNSTATYYDTTGDNTFTELNPATGELTGSGYSRKGTGFGVVVINSQYGNDHLTTAPVTYNLVKVGIWQ